MKPLFFEKPQGTSDLLAPILERKLQVMEQMSDYIKKWAYLEIETPVLEYYDTVGRVTTTKERNLFKLLDHSGNTLVLRPDFTAPIARVASSLLKNEPLPLRIMYRGQVFRAPKGKAGKIEFSQMGAELIGCNTIQADAEVIALAVNTLLSIGVNDFKIAVGHIGFIEGFFNYYIKDMQTKERLKELLIKRDYVAFRTLIKGLSISQEAKNGLLMVITLRGNKDILGEMKDINLSSEITDALSQLTSINEMIEDYGITDYLIFDLSLLGKQDYYTGLIFEGFSGKIPYPILNGGRYDNLLKNFSKNTPATGFAISVEGIMEASSLLAPEQKLPILVLYEPSKRKNAFQHCKLLREKGEAVVTACSTENLWWKEKQWKDVLVIAE